MPYYITGGNMATLSQKYANKETRDGIAVNKTYLVPVEQLYLEAGYNIREADQQHVEYFANCWAEGQPLPALKVMPTAYGIKIVDGQHRYLGALLAMERGIEIARIECKDFTGTEADRIAFMVSSSQGKSLDPFERSKAYKRLKALGWTNEEISKRVGRSVSDVQMHLSLGDVPDEIKKRVSGGQVSYATAVAVTREHGDNAESVIEQAVQEAQKEGKSKVTAKTLAKVSPAKKKGAARAMELLKFAKQDGDTLVFPEGVVEELMEIINS